MSKQKILYERNYSGEGIHGVVLRYKEGRKWRLLSSWRFHVNPSSGFCFIVILTPFFRFTRDRGSWTLGFGNHYVEVYRG